MAKVLVFRGRRKERSYDLTGRQLVIGRGEGADIRVDNPLVSRTHATLTFDSGVWKVEDLDAPNGLYVNGERVKDRVLRPGDKIELGQHVVVFAGADDSAWDVATVGDKRLTDMGGNEPTAILPPREVESIQRRVQRRMQCHLVIEEGSYRKEIALEGDNYIVGFDSGSDIKLPGKVLFGKKVAELVRKDEGWAVVALSSLAPLKLRGNKVSSRQLADGDILKVKNVELRFHAAIAP